MNSYSASCLKCAASWTRAEEKLNVYRQQRDSVDLNTEAKAVLEQIVNVDNQLNELTFREAEISQLYKKDHPTYRALLEKRQTLEQERKRLNKRVSAMPSTQQEVLRLSRDVEAGRAVYLQLLNRQQELSISKSSAIGNVRIIDPAVTQPQPVKPKKSVERGAWFYSWPVYFGGCRAGACDVASWCRSTGTTGRARHQRLCHYPNVRVAG